MPEAFEKISGGMMNLILGALIVWVGQTTFQHAGVLASLDEKLTSIDDEFLSVDKRHESLRKWLENVVTDMKDNNRSQFTSKEGDKLVGQIRKVEDATLDLERKLAVRISDLEIRLTALAANQQNAQQIAALESEVARLRYAVAQPASATQPAYQTASGGSSQIPVYLPPVGARR